MGMYGRFAGWEGGGGDSNAKSATFWFSTLFSKISLHKGGGGGMLPFRNLQEKAVSEMYGLGAARRPNF